MAAYVVFIREGAIADQAAMDKYFAGNSASPPPASLKPLVVYGQMETIEGEGADGLVILEFPDTASAREWYYSDDYQARAKFRMAAAPYRGFIVEGF